MRNYRVIVSYEGMSTVLDRAILRAVHGRGGKGNDIEFEGSGFGRGFRDLSFIVPSRSWAQGIERKMSKLDKGIHVECEEAYHERA
jgi:hypothetical protein